MRVETIIFLVLLVILDRVIHKKFPTFYKRMQLPLNIVLTALAAVYAGALLCSLCGVLTDGSVSIWSKLGLFLFIGACVAGLAFAVWLAWRDWYRLKKYGTHYIPESAKEKEEEQERKEP